jgi:hypothetical protein
MEKIDLMLELLTRIEARQLHTLEAPKDGCECTECAFYRRVQLHFERTEALSQ